MIKLGCVNPNPALFCNHVHVYLAQELKSTGKQNLDEDEFINIETYTIDELVEKIFHREIGDSKTVAAIMAYKAKYQD